MDEQIDPRLTVTRERALTAALELLKEKGVLAVTHAAIKSRTGISRSTLYRHWPELAALRNDAFLRAATVPLPAEISKGSLRGDLTWHMENLTKALNETPWGQVAPHVIASAATDADARSVINEFMRDRIRGVEAIFATAEQRGELKGATPNRHLVEAAIAIPYFRKFIAGLPLDKDWLEGHIDAICDQATEGNASDGPASPNQG